MIRAIEEDAAELLMAIGTVSGGNSVMSRACTGRSLVRRSTTTTVVAAALDPATAGKAIAESLRLLEQYGVPGNLPVNAPERFGRVAPGRQLHPRWR